jgi:hypothetical protein
MKTRVYSGVKRELVGSWPGRKRQKKFSIKSQRQAAKLETKKMFLEALGSSICVSNKNLRSFGNN